MKLLYILISLSLVYFPATAQEKGNIRGSLVDTALKQPVTDATITVMNASDSSLVTFSRSNSKGDFNVAYLDKGKYRLLITHVSYRNVSRFFEISEATKTIDLGYIIL